MGQARKRRAAPAVSTARSRAYARRLEQISRARVDPNVFMEYVFGVKQEHCHRIWQNLWQTSPASVIHGSVGIGKSVQVKGHLLHSLGNDHDERVIYLSATQRHPKKQLRSIRSMIERDERLHHVFPKLKPGNLWKSYEIEIDRLTTEADPTIQVFGAYTESILGSRATKLVIDDLCNFTNTLTEDGRQKMIEWLGSVLSRLTGENVQIIVLGNFWHKFDALMDLVRNRGFEYRRDPAYVEVEGERVPTAPSVLSLEQIARLERQLGPLQTETMLLCRSPAQELGRFKSVWFEKALAAGAGRPFRPEYVSAGSCFAGVDLGHTQKVGSDRSAIVVAQVLPTGHRQVIDVRSGRWSGPEIRDQLLDVRRRYGAIIGVESNAAQNLLIELVRDIACIPLVDHHTGVNKHNKATGIESLGHELAQGMWVFPSPRLPLLDEQHGLVEPDADESRFDRWTLGGDAMQPHLEVQGVINDALVYDPTKHTGDRLMAWWICAETIRRSTALASLGMASIADALSLDIFAR